MNQPTAGSARPRPGTGPNQAPGYASSTASSSRRGSSGVSEGNSAPVPAGRRKGMGMGMGRGIRRGLAATVRSVASSQAQRSRPKNDPGRGQGPGQRRQQQLRAAVAEPPDGPRRPPSRPAPAEAEAAPAAEAASVGPGPRGGVLPRGLRISRRSAPPPAPKAGTAAPSRPSDGLSQVSQLTADSGPVPGAPDAPPSSPDGDGDGDGDRDDYAALIGRPSSSVFRAFPSLSRPAPRPAPPPPKSAAGGGSRSSSSPPAAAAPSPAEAARHLSGAAASLDAAGHAFLEEGRAEDALEAYRKALRLKRRLLGGADGDRDGDGEAGGGHIPRGTGAGSAGPEREALLTSVATSVNNMCYARQKLGLAGPDEAMSAYRSALELKRRAAGGDGDGDGDGDGRPGDGGRSSSQRMNKTKKNKKNKNRNRNKKRKNKGKVQPAATPAADSGIARTLNNIGTVHLSTGAYLEALASFNEARNLAAAQLGEDHMDLATIRSNAGDALMGAGRYGNAVEEYGRSLRIRRLGGYPMDHRKSRRLLGKIQIAARAARAKEERESWESELPTEIYADGEEEERWGFSFPLDSFESESEDDGDGMNRQLSALKSELQVDLDRMGDLSDELVMEVEFEQSAMTDVIMGDSNGTDDTASESAVESRENDTKTGSRRISSVGDGEAAVRDVRTRLAMHRARKKAWEADRLEALRLRNDKVQAAAERMPQD